MTEPGETLDLRARRRQATRSELDAVNEAFRLAGRSAEPLPRVVLAYPGVGVGERHPELAGCTSQLLLVGAVRGSLNALGVDVVAMSTQDPNVGPMRAMPDAALRVTHDVAGRLPHIDLDGTRHLTRFTLVVGGALDGTIFDEITDSVAHTKAVVELITAARTQPLG
jgi:hypothetical protein